MRPFSVSESERFEIKCILNEGESPDQNENGSLLITVAVLYCLWVLSGQLERNYY